MRFGQGFTELVDGDTRWSGVDMTRDRSLLAPGMLAKGVNTRLRTGRIQQRGGTIQPPDFNPAFEARLIGSGVYRNPNGDEIMLFAPAGVTYVVAVEYGKDPYKINYSAAEIARGGNNGVGRVAFVQAFEKVLLIRSPDIIGTPPMVHLVWNGTGDANNDGVADTNFEIIALSATGSQLVPSTWDGEAVADRVIYYNANYKAFLGRDYWIMSDIQDYTSFDAVYQVGRTNSGESDYITRIKEYFHGSFLVYKSNSIYQVTIVPGVYPIQFTQRTLSSRLGSFGQRMPLSVGADEIFLSEPGGFYRLSEVIQEQVATLPVAVSESIQPIIDQLNWPVTKIFGCSAAIDNYALFGVAIGLNATRCNAILVYDTQSRQWISAPDTWPDPAFGFNALHVTTYNGAQRVFAVDYNNAANTGPVYLLYEGLFDLGPKPNWKIGKSEAIPAVHMIAETRGYAGGDPFSFKRFLRTSVGIATVAPRINLTAVFDGVNEEKVLEPQIVKDPTKYYTHGKADFNALTDDPNQPMREDYEIVQPEAAETNVAIEDFEELFVGVLLSLPGTDIITAMQLPFVQKQETQERRIVRGTGRWCSIRIENIEGICDVLGVSIEGTQTANNVRTAA